jgi:hypothetical protein
MAGCGRLKAAVYVQDPATREELILLPGQCPEPEVAALVTNPDAWETPPDGDDGTEPIVVGEPVPTAGNTDQEMRASGPGTKKAAPRRVRSSSSS